MSLIRLFSTVRSRLFETQENLVQNLIACRSYGCRKKRKKSKDRCGKKKKKHPVKGKVALITGGAVGIGYSYAKLLLACGAKGVFISGRREELGRKAVCKLSEEFGDNRVIFLKCDVSKSDDIKRAFKCTKEYFKVRQPDIVVNNAGILEDGKWRQTVRINCEGLLDSTLQAFANMGTHKGYKGGVIVNVASIVGLQDFYGSPVYGASKHFVIGLTRNLGKPFYYKQSKVKVMAQLPGVTDTAMVSKSHARGGLKQFKGTAKKTAEQLASLPSQPSDACGCHLITMLEDGENGALWISEDSECYKVKLPDRLKLKRFKKGQRVYKKKSKCGKKNKKKRKKCGKKRKRRGGKKKKRCGRKKKKSRCGRRKKKRCGKKRKRCRDD